MYAIVNNNTVTQVGELSVLFPNTSNPNHEFAQEQGALEVIEGEQKDQRYYWVTFDSYVVNGNVVVRNYINTPKALEDITETPEGQTESVTTKGLKSTQIAQVKQACNSKLSQTDWAVTRKMERNIDIPADIIAERAEAVAECNRLEAAILATNTIEEFIQVVSPVSVGEP